MPVHIKFPVADQLHPRNTQSDFARQIEFFHGRLTCLRQFAFFQSSHCATAFPLKLCRREEKLA